MSRPPWRASRGRAIRCAGVGGGDVELQRGAADSVGDRGQRVPRRRDVDGDDVWRRPGPAPRRSTAPMPRAAPVTTATLPASGVAQSAGSAGVAAADADDLPVDVGRPAGQQEPQRRVGVGLGALGDEDEVRGRAARAAPCRSTGRSPRGPAGPRPAPGSRRLGGGSAEDEHPAGGRSRLSAGARKSCAAARSAGVVDPVASRTTAPTVAAVGDLGRDRRRRRPRRAARGRAPRAGPPGRRRATGPGQQRLARHVPAQLGRAGQAELLGDRRADAGVAIAVPVAHVAGAASDPDQAASRIATTPWPPAAQIEIRPRAPDPFSCSILASEATIRPPVAANG